MFPVCPLCCFIVISMDPVSEINDDDDDDDDYSKIIIEYRHNVRILLASLTVSFITLAVKMLSHDVLLVDRSEDRNDRTVGWH